MSVSLTRIRIEEGLWECVARSNPCNQLFAFFSFTCPRHPELKTGTLRPASWSDAHRPFYLPVDLTGPPAAKLRLDGSIIVPCMLPGNQTVPLCLFRFSVDRSAFNASWRQKTCCSTYKDMNRRAAYVRGTNEACESACTLICRLPRTCDQRSQGVVKVQARRLFTPSLLLWGWIILKCLKLF